LDALHKLWHEVGNGERSDKPNPKCTTKAGRRVADQHGPIAQWANSVEKLSYSALTPNLAEQNSEFLKLGQRHWVQSEFRRLIFCFSETCRCCKEFFNRMGGNQTFAACATQTVGFARSGHITDIQQ
jgi:hypothetical protein